MATKMMGGNYFVNNRNIYLKMNGFDYPIGRFYGASIVLVVSMKMRFEMSVYQRKILFDVTYIFYTRAFFGKKTPIKGTDISS